MRERWIAFSGLMCLVQFAVVEHTAIAGKPHHAITKFSPGLLYPSRLRVSLPEKFHGQVIGSQAWRIMGSCALNLLNNHTLRNHRGTKPLVRLTKGLREHYKLLNGRTHFALVTAEDPGRLKFYRVENPDGTLGDDGDFLETVRGQSQVAGGGTLDGIEIGSLEVDDGAITTTFDHAQPQGPDWDSDFDNGDDAPGPSHVVAYRVKISRGPAGQEDIEFSQQFLARSAEWGSEPLTVVRNLKERYQRGAVVKSRLVQAVQDSDGERVPMKEWPAHIFPERPYAE